MELELKRRGLVSAAAILMFGVSGARMAPADDTKPAPQDLEFFENKVRPVLANKCYACHTKVAMSGLRVDSRAALLKGGNSGAPAVVPGDPDKSLLIRAVKQSDPELKMPKGGKLSEKEIEDLVEWVKMGAPWPDSGAAAKEAAMGPDITPEQRRFWSFQPLAQPPIPTVARKGWTKTPIDSFVLAELDSQGLQPVRLADRRTLIRRATYDLTGLPATLDEIKAFENDKSSKAWETVVDRLLASPRYGERWGRHWLDIVRYAEDDVRGLDPMGRGFMPYAGAWVFRDWVIQAFNQDMPYNMFVKAQLAGDLLDERDPKKYLPGTAMLGQGPWLWDQAEPVQGRADERNERIDMVTRGMLGLTVACARCHNHKYDPVMQKDYYALGGVFANTTYKEYSVVTDAERQAWEKQEQQLFNLQKEFREFTRKQSEALSEVLAHQTTKYMVGAWKVTGEPKAKVPEVASKDELDPEMLQRWVQFLARPPKFYPYLKDWQAMVASGGTEDQAKALAEDFQTLVLGVMQRAKELKDENDVIKGKAGVLKRPERDAKPSEFETDDQFCPGCGLELKTMPTEKANLWIDVFQRSLESDEFDPEPGLFVFSGYALSRQLGATYKDHIKALQTEVEAQKKALPKQYGFVHGVADKPDPRDIAINIRGNPHNLGPEVPRRFVAVLVKADAPSFQKGSGRLELAENIAASPLAARVIVNRIWRWHFGTGIVDTPDNFGKMGDPPSNPELLEYLASHFVSEGMSMKKLHREILLSSVYQLSADDSPVNREKDPANRLYWRFNRQRLDVEEIRDSLLVAGGVLDLEDVSGPSSEFNDDNKRRTVFGKVSRYRLDNTLQVFDFPVPTATAEQRFTTNVPLQRLFFMNSNLVYKQANLLAKRVCDESSDSARVTKAYQIVYGRAPTEKEVRIALEFLAKNPDKPGESVTGEPSTAWKQYARALLSSNEFEFVE